MKTVNKQKYFGVYSQLLIFILSLCGLLTPK